MSHFYNLSQNVQFYNTVKWNVVTIHSLDLLLKIVLQKFVCLIKNKESYRLGLEKMVFDQVFNSP